MGQILFLTRYCYYLLLQLYPRSVFCILREPSRATVVVHVENSKKMGMSYTKLIPHRPIKTQILIRYPIFWFLLSHGMLITTSFYRMGRTNWRGLKASLQSISIYCVYISLYSALRINYVENWFLRLNRMTRKSKKKPIYIQFIRFSSVF